jgi:hypothetical protein
MRGLTATLLALPICVFAQSKSEPFQAATPALYEKALSAIQSGQLEWASQLLQQFVQQNPDWAGAWLDLSLLAFRQENYAQAEEFLLVLEQRFSPLPDGIQLAVLQLKKKLSAHLKLENSLAANASYAPLTLLQNSQHQTAISLAAGYDNNVNGGLRFSTITLTLPDRNLDLSVAASNRPMAAAFTRAGFVHQMKLPFEEGALTFQMQIQSRSYQGLPQFTNQESFPQASLEHNALPGVLTLGMQAVALNHVLAYKAPILRWQYEHSAPPLELLSKLACVWQQQIQMEQRQYLFAPHQNSHWWGVKPMLQCSAGLSRTHFYAQRAQENDATGNRPGGNTRQVLWGLQQDWLRPFGLEGHRMQAKLEAQNSTDSLGYSYLLANGAPRIVNNRIVQIGWNAPMLQNNAWRWSLGLQSNHQRSNLTLFTQRNYSLESSVWRAW